MPVTVVPPSLRQRNALRAESRRTLKDALWRVWGGTCEAVLAGYPGKRFVTSCPAFGAVAVVSRSLSSMRRPRVSTRRTWSPTSRSEVRCGWAASTVGRCYTRCRVLQRATGSRIDGSLAEYRRAAGRPQLAYGVQVVPTHPRVGGRSKRVPLSGTFLTALSHDGSGRKVPPDARSVANRLGSRSPEREHPVEHIDRDSGFCRPRRDVRASEPAADALLFR